MRWDRRGSRRLKLRELNILLAVADAGSMAKAATRLAISQPAISHAIADMERTLGVTLFDRSPQGVEPTRYGRALLKRGLAVFDELDQGVQEIEFLANPGTGELYIGSSAALSEGIVLPVIDRLSREYPRVIFHVEPVSLPEIFDELRERRIELGFARSMDLLLKPICIRRCSSKTRWLWWQAWRVHGFADARSSWPS